MNEPLSEQFYIAAQDWCDKEAAASLLEDTKSSIFSQMMEKILLSGHTAVNRAEIIVKGSEEWKEYIEKTNKARKEANFAKVKMDYLRIKFNEWQSNEANARVEARL